MSGYVLVVDDQFAVRFFLQQVLQEYGYRVKLAASGGECLSLAVAAERPGLILLDQRMPAMTGIQVLSRLSQDERTRDIPVIMMSAQADFVAEAHRLGVREVLAKPLDVEVLIHAVREALKEFEAPLSEEQPH